MNKPLLLLVILSLLSPLISQQLNSQESSDEYVGRMLPTNCTALQYQYSNGSCLANCTTPFISSVVNGSKYCNFPCSAGQYLQYDGMCIASCTGFTVKTRSQGGYLYCDLDTTCSTSVFKYPNNTCISTCNAPLTSQTINSYKFCNTPCPQGQFLYQDSTCQPACNSNGNYRVRNESGLLYCDVNNVCSSTLFRYPNNTCIGNCQAPWVPTTISTSKFCNYPCAASEYAFPDTTCRANCGTNGNYKSRTESGNLFCDINSTCSSTTFKYPNGTCQGSCPSPMISETMGQSKFCYSPCAAGQYAYPNATCMPTCTNSAAFKQRNEGPGMTFCDVNSTCTSGTWKHTNNTCTSACPLPYISTNLHGFSFCNFPCNATQFGYQNGSCLGKCGDGYRNRTEGSYKICDLIPVVVDSTTITIPKVATTTLAVTIRYDITVANFNAANGTAKFIAQMASILKVAESRIKIISIREGSTIIDSEVSVESGTDSASVAAANSQVTTMQQTLNSAVNSGSMNIIPGASILNYSTSVTTKNADETTVTPTTEGGLSQQSMYLIIGLTVGPVVILLIVVAIISYKNYRFNKQRILRVGAEKIESSPGRSPDRTMGPSPTNTQFYNDNGGRRMIVENLA